MTYKFISLPIELASEKLKSQLHTPMTDDTLLISYLAEMDIMGFSSILSEKEKEYMCESEKEFHEKVSHEKLMRLLWNLNTLR